MVAGRINRILAIGEVLPDAIGKILMLRAFEQVLVSLMLTAHFLQKHNIGLQATDQLTLFVQHQSGIETCDPFVDVEGGDAQSIVHGSMIYFMPFRAQAALRRMTFAGSPLY